MGFILFHGLVILFGFVFLFRDRVICLHSAGAFCRRLFCRFSACEQVSKGIEGIVAGQFSEATQIEWIVTVFLGCPSRECKQVFIHGRVLLSVFDAQKSRSHP